MRVLAPVDLELIRASFQECLDYFSVNEFEVRMGDWSKAEAAEFFAVLMSSRKRITIHRIWGDG